MKPKILLLISGIIFSLNLQTLVGEEIIDPGDKVKLQILGVTDKIYDVNENGDIDFDLWGKISVRNLNQQQAIQEIKNKLSGYIRFENKPVFLSIKKKPVVKHQNYISVFGEIRKPGSYPAKGNLKVLDYIVLSGGTTRFALTDSIKVICEKEGKVQGEDFNLQLFSSGANTPIPGISAGCVIYVPEKPAEKASWMRNRSDQVIHIFGQVNKPGRYEFAEEFSFLDILSHAGGMTTLANTTKISIISHKRSRFFNLYAYLKGGGNIPHLHKGDVIFIPQRQKATKASWTNLPSNRVIHIMGEVNKPGRYEFTAEFTFLDILSHAGGVKGQGDSKKVSIISNDKVVSFDLDHYFRKGGEVPHVQTGDVIFIPQLQNGNSTSWTHLASNRVIHILGEVNKPGRYEFSSEFSFLDILSNAGGIKEQGDIRRVSIISSRGARIYNLDHFLKSGGKVPEVNTEDVIYVPPKSKKKKDRWVELPSERSIYLIGAFQSPGRYEFTSNLSFLDLLSQAGGPNSEADTKRIRIMRNNQLYKVFNFFAYQNNNKIPPPDLLPEDVIFIPTIDPDKWIHKENDLKITIMGEVIEPGSYEFENRSPNFIDILASASGPSTTADLSAIKIIRRYEFKEIDEQKRKQKVVLFDFKKYQDPDDVSELPRMFAGDTIIVPSIEKSFWEEFKTIGGALGIVSVLLVIL